MIRIPDDGSSDDIRVWGKEDGEGTQGDGRIEEVDTGLCVRGYGFELAMMLCDRMDRYIDWRVGYNV
jgi:hypothetical protein